jgi:spore germination protein GerM
MTFNGGGKRKKKLKKNEVRITSRTLELSESQHELYAYVSNELGDCRFTVEVIKPEEETPEVRTCKLMKSLKSGPRIVKGTLVLISIENCSFDKGFIIHIYTDQERNKLKKMKVIPSEYTEENVEEETEELEETEEINKKNKQEKVVIEESDDSDFDFDEI